MSLAKFPRAIETFMLGCVMLIAPLSALAQYPDKPIRFIMGFGPGSATDSIARTVARGMSDALGQPIIVENRAGALSTIATEAVVHAKPDGYTVLIAASSGMSMAPAGLMKNVRYDPMVDLEAVGHMIQAPYVLLIDPKLAITTVDELIKYMRANVNSGTCGSGNASGRVYCELFKRTSGLDINMIPYKSTPDAALGVMGGQVSMVFLDLVSALPRIRSSQLRPLTLMATARHQVITDVPTSSESGLVGNPLNVGWIAMFGPAKLPKPIVAGLNSELNVVLNKPDVRRTLEQSAYQLMNGSPAELATYLKNDFEAWKKLIRELNIPPEN